MRVTIIEILSRSVHVEVRARAECGEFVAHWIGTPPQVGRNCFVELKCDDIFTFGVNASVSSDNTCAITYANGQVTLNGLCERVEGDGITYLRLGTSVVMLEFEDQLPPVSTWVRLRTKQLRMYDCDL